MVAGVTLNVLVGVNKVFPVQQRPWCHQVSNQFIAEDRARRSRSTSFSAPTDEGPRSSFSESGQGRISKARHHVHA